MKSVSFRPLFEPGTEHLIFARQDPECKRKSTIVSCHCLIALFFGFCFNYFQRQLQRLTYLDELDMDDRKKLSFFHVVPNSILTVKWWPEWASLIQAAYRGDLKSKSFYLTTWSFMC